MIDMKIQDQVCTLEQAKLLKGLRVVQESIFYHNSRFNTPVIRDTILGTNPKITMVFNDSESVSAFTVMELIEMLPVSINSLRLTGELEVTKDRLANGTMCYTVGYFTKDKNLVFGGTLLSLRDAVAETIIKLIGQGVITVDEVNARLCEKM